MLRYHIIPVTPYQQNCCIISCTQTNQAAVVDPGGDIPLILKYLQQHPELSVDKILLTHGHLDHCGQAPALAFLLNVPIIGPHHADAFWLQQLADISHAYRSKGFEPAVNFTPNKWLIEGDVVTVGAQRLQVLHCFGHTPGHVVFFHADSALAWVGDVIFKNSIGRTDFPQGNLADLLHNIRYKLLPLGADVRFISGHGVTSTFADEMACNPYLQFD